MALVRRSRSVALAVVALAAALARAAPGEGLPEIELRAAFLLNFAKYVEWPAGAFDRTDGSLVLCVVQEPRLLDELRRLASGETLDGRPLWVHGVAEAAEAPSCQVIYVADPDEPRLPAIRRSIAGLPVLTVGDGREFLNRGGMIALVRSGGRLRFEIDNGRAEDAGLKLSSQLLKLARRVVGVRSVPGAS